MKTNAEITDMVQMATRWDDAGNCHHGIEVGFDTRAGEREVMFVENGLLSPQLGTARRPKPRPQGAMHDKTTDAAIEMCQAVGAEFWSLTDAAPRSAYATRGDEYLLVKMVPRQHIVEVTPVDAYGRETGTTDTITHHDV